MITYFYMQYFGSKQNLVSAKLPFKIQCEDFKDNFVWNDYKSDFKTLKTMLGSFGVAVPTLYKQYSELCEEGGIEFCDFNIDPNFSDCIDGFIVVDVTKVKEAQQKRYIYNQ